MRCQGSGLTEQGVTFAVIIVNRSVIHNRIEAHKIIQNFQQQIFSGMPVILMAQDPRGTPTYYGRQDISRFLSRVPLSAIPWKEYDITY